MDTIFQFLSNIENVKVVRAFENTDFSLVDKTPIITVGFSKSTSSQTAINEGDGVLEPTLYLGVFTHKSFGLKECEDLSAQVISAIMPICESAEFSSSKYVSSLKRFRCEITLKLKNEIFKIQPHIM